MPLTLTAGTDDSGRRLDRLLRKALRDLPLSAVHRLLRKGAVLVDGQARTAEYRVQAGQTVTVNSLSLDAPSGLPWADLSAARVSRADSPRARIPPPEILFEGNGLLFLNKPAGLPVHGGRIGTQSLEDFVLAYLGPKLPPSLSFRPGPLHRLDMPSSGVIAFSSSLEGARLFSAAMRGRKIKKWYLAIVEGVIRKREVWQDELERDSRRQKTFVRKPDDGDRRGFRGAFSDGPADGRFGGGTSKDALTRVTPLAENGTYTLVSAEIETGRTHQIRAQAAGRGHPLVGDVKYGGNFAGSGITAGGANGATGAGGRITGGGFFLHAWRVELPEEFPLPRLIEAPPPENFQKKIRELFGRPFAVLQSGGDSQPPGS